MEATAPYRRSAAASAEVDDAAIAAARAGYRHSRAVMVATIVLFVACSACSVFRIYWFFETRGRYGEIVFEQAALVLRALAFVALILVVRRANMNARVLGAGDMRFTPMTAALLLLVPCMNIIVAFSILRELWKASGAEHQGTDWQLTRTPFRLFAWWGSFAGATMALYVWKAGSSRSILSRHEIGAVATAFDAAMFAFALATLLGIRSRQSARMLQYFSKKARDQREYDVASLAVVRQIAAHNRPRRRRRPLGAEG